MARAFRRTGASVVGKRMFDAGEHTWPEEAPFYMPAFVLTHEERESWKRPGGTTFSFLRDGIESALRQARAAPGDQDVRVAGGGETIQQHLNAGLTEEFSVAVSPVLFGTGIRQFEGVDVGRGAAADQRGVDAVRDRPDLRRAGAITPTLGGFGLLGSSAIALSPQGFGAWSRRTWPGYHRSPELRSPCS